MRTLSPQRTLVEQVYEAILSEISAGKFAQDHRLIQEELADSLGVSRQPVQQALLLLRSHGLLRDAPGRGLMVAPLDTEHVRNLYEVRGVLDGLGAALAAERGSEIARKEGPAFIARGREAVASKSIARMITTDMDFHFFLYGLAGNPLVAESSAAHWSYLRRVMGEVLLRGETPAQIWGEHKAILDAVIAADPAEADRLARAHIAHASDALAVRLADHVAADASKSSPKRRAKTRR